MTIETLDFAEPFFTVRYLVGERAFQVSDKTIVINMSERPIRIEGQRLGFFQSLVVTNTCVSDVERGILVERFDSHGDERALLDAVKKRWPLAYDVRREERLKGVSHYMSPKAHIGNTHLSMYHAGSVPLNVGLHKRHTHCGDQEPREVHTQIVGFGKMQQCLERDINTLYIEELMAPGTTHKPMFDEQGEYPWHQYETITPGIFMAIEVLPSDASG